MRLNKNKNNNMNMMKRKKKNLTNWKGNQHGIAELNVWILYKITLTKLLMIIFNIYYSINNNLLVIQLLSALLRSEIGEDVDVLNYIIINLFIFINIFSQFILFYFLLFYSIFYY